MSSRCPEGHLSGADDYCDVCGAPMAPGPPTPSVPGGAPLAPDGGGSGRPPDVGGAGPSADTDGLAAAPEAQTCPNCATPNPATHLFCEVCGFDFTTGVMPRPISLAEGSFLTIATPSSPAPPAPDEGAGLGLGGTPDDGTDPDEGPAPAGADETDGAADEPRTDDAGDADGETPGLPAQAVTADESPGELQAAVPVPAADPAPIDGSPLDLETPPRDGTVPAATSDDLPASRPAEPASEPLPGPEPTGDPAPTEAPPEPALSQRRTRYVPPSRAMETSWVAEIWVDPDWYAVQSSSDPCPSPMLPDVVPLPTTSALIGRPSASRNIRPDIDCGSDSGVSRRQAQLTSDGRRWWVEDLGSSNGTYVGPASGPVPTTALTPGRRVEVDADDRIYVGAWTRIVVRPATASEVAGQG